jgi:hypothetical protein
MCPGAPFSPAIPDHPPPVLDEMPKKSGGASRARRRWRSPPPGRPVSKAPLHAILGLWGSDAPRAAGVRRAHLSPAWAQRRRGAAVRKGFSRVGYGGVKWRWACTGCAEAFGQT